MAEDWDARVAAVWADDGLSDADRIDADRRSGGGARPR